jgi:hypothetical protein
MKTDLTLFEEYRIRRFYDEETETWWFSVLDIVRVERQRTIIRPRENTGTS